MSSSLTGSWPTVGIVAAAATGRESGLRIPFRERIGGIGESLLVVNL